MNPKLPKKPVSKNTASKPKETTTEKALRKQITSFQEANGKLIAEKNHYKDKVDFLQEQSDFWIESSTWWQEQYANRETEFNKMKEELAKLTAPALRTPEQEKLAGNDNEDYPCKHCDYAFECPFANLDKRMREMMCLHFSNIKIEQGKKRERDAINSEALKDAPELTKPLFQYQMN